MQCNPVKMFLSRRQAGYSNRQQRQPRPVYKSDKCEVRKRYFAVGGQMAGCRHILTGLQWPTQSFMSTTRDGKVGCNTAKIVYNSFPVF